MESNIVYSAFNPKEHVVGDELKLEVGKYYEDGCGNHFRILYESTINNSEFPFLAICMNIDATSWFTRDGRWSDELSFSDLVRELTETVPTPAEEDTEESSEEFHERMYGIARMVSDAEQEGQGEQEDLESPQFVIGDILGYDADTAWYRVHDLNRDRGYYRLGYVDNTNVSTQFNFNAAHKTFVKIEPDHPARFCVTPNITIATMETVYSLHGDSMVMSGSGIQQLHDMQKNANDMISRHVAALPSNGPADDVSHKCTPVDTGMRKTWCKTCDKDMTHE